MDRTRKTKPAETPHPARLEVLAKSTARAADELELSNATLGRVLGLSEASVSRMRRGAADVLVNGKSYELAALFVRLFRSLYAMTGGDMRAARSWLATSNRALHQIPLDAMQTVVGLTAVVAYVDSFRGRI
jgi:hypothetical protein